MSSSGDVALQRRDPTLHIAQGDKQRYDRTYTPPSHIFDIKEPSKITIRPDVHKPQVFVKSAYRATSGGCSTAEFLERKRQRKQQRMNHTH